MFGKRSWCRMAGLLLAAGVAAGVSAQGPAGIPPAPEPSVLDRLGVTAAGIQTLALPARPEEAIAFRVVLAGRQYTVDLALDPVDAPGCEMVLDDGSGRLRTEPAPPPATYRGAVRGVPGSHVSGGLTGAGLMAVVVLGPELGAWDIVPLGMVRPGAGAGEHVVYRQDDQAPAEWGCAVRAAAEGGAPASRGGGGAGGPDVLRYCDLAIEADYPFFQQCGSSAAATAQDVATVLANVSSYYWLSGVPVRFRVVRYIIRTTPQGNPGLYNTSNPNTLLDGLRQVWTNLAGHIPRDATHMFTGRDLDGVNIGIAYLGTVCNTPFAYGLSQSRFSLQPGRRAALTAHELGHNFSAHHCDESGFVCLPCNIMSAFQGSTTVQLTRLGCSAGVMADFAATRACLGTQLRGDGADFDGDGRVTVADFVAFQGAAARGDAEADLDGDGRVTVGDVAGFVGAYAGGR